MYFWNAVKHETKNVGRLSYPLRIHRILNYIASSGQRDAVFIWIPKTAGSSVWTFLRQYHCPKLKSYYAAKHCFCQRGWVTFAHQSYPQLLEANVVNQEFDQRAFKFCFVRNPYDRAVSLYFYLKRIGDVHHKLSFKGFVRVLQNRAIPEIGLYNRQGLSQCNSQVRWLKNRKRELLVDFIGRFENIEKDFKKLCSELGTKGQLPHVNRTEHTHYKNYYDDETKRIVANIYAEDLEQFSYAF